MAPTPNSTITFFLFLAEEPTGYYCLHSAPLQMVSDWPDNIYICRKTWKIPVLAIVHNYDSHQFFVEGMLEIAGIGVDAESTWFLCLSQVPELGFGKKY